MGNKGKEMNKKETNYFLAFDCNNKQIKVDDEVFVLFPTPLSQHPRFKNIKHGRKSNSVIKIKDHTPIDGLSNCAIVFLDNGDWEFPWNLKLKDK